VTPEEIVSTMANFYPDEKEIVAAIIQRIDRGREQYGPWEIDQDRGRDYVQEALEENFDCMVYQAAQLVKIQNERRRRMTRIYVCHPWRDDPAGNARKLEEICHVIVENGALPVCPPLFLSRFLCEETERALALKLCLEMLSDCDVVFQFDEPTEGMSAELLHAEKLGIPVVSGERPPEPIGASE